MTLLGISTGALLNKWNLDCLLAFEPDVVEFYNYPSSALPQIRSFCLQNQIQPALHTPVPCDEQFRYFMPTGPDPELAIKALHMAETTILCALELNARHVVVHFPSPTSKGIQNRDFAVRRFLDPLARLAEDVGVQVLIENLSPNPDFYTPEHYKEILDDYPVFDFCLDLGHAHLLNPTCTIEGFIQTLTTKIRSVHVYNTTIIRYARYKHESVHPEQQPQVGWLDVPNSISLLRQFSNPDVIILEPHPLELCQIQPAVEGINWLRRLLSM